MVAKIQQYVEIRQNRDRQDRPYLVGTRLRVQDIVIDHERFGQSAEEIAAGFDHLSLAQVHGVLTYYFENRDFVWQCIHDDEAYAKSVRESLTGVALPAEGTGAVKGKGTDIADTTVSS